MLCALASQDPGSAREIFSQMSSDAKTAPLTQYLMFKVALRSGDQEAGGHASPRKRCFRTDFSAAPCLDVICRSANETTLLYACVLEAQETADKFIAAAALQKVLEKCEHQVPEGVHLPALLRWAQRHSGGFTTGTKVYRCAARLLLSDHEKGQVTEGAPVDGLCQVFERGQ